MNISHSKHFRAFILVCMYAIALITFAVLGIIGNTDTQALQTTQKYFPLEAISAARAYFRWGAVSSLFLRLCKLALLFFFIYMHRRIIFFLEHKIPQRTMRLILMAGLTLLALQFISFPFAIVSDYLRKKAFGLLASSFTLWLYRYAISALVGIIVSLGAILIFAWVASRFRRYYLLFPAAILVLSLSAILIYPRVVLPLTHSIQPLEDGALKSSIAQMLQKAGSPVSAIYVLNESKYSKSVNAFFTGWGPYREIYLFDSLLNNYTHDEVLTVVAHELCHYREEHVIIGILLGTFGLLLVIAFMGFMCCILFNQTLVIAAREMKISHLLLVFSVIVFIAQPIKNSISRAMERRCDAYACALINNRAVFAEMERKITLTNRADVLPHPVYHFWFGTHPSPMERIESALIIEPETKER